MKTCPVCKLDYADDFKFCEFDGSLLAKASLPEKQSFLNSYAFATFLSGIRRLPLRNPLKIAGILILTLAVFLVIATGRKAHSHAVAQSVASNLNQQAAEPVFFETPQAARDYNESAETDAESQSDRNKGNENTKAEKPGVVVYKPDTTDGKSNPSSTADDSKPRKPELKRPKRTEIDLPESRTSDSSPTEPQPRRQTDERQSEPAQTNEQPTRTYHAPAPRSSSTQAVVNHNADLSSDSENDLVNLSLVHIRAYRTDLGVRYELTLNMRHQGAKMIRWDRLTLSTNSLSGIRHSETIPFYQRLGVNGTMNFTVSIEMRGRRDNDLQGRLNCSAVGEDIDGKAVKAGFSTRINSF